MHENTKTFLLNFTGLCFTLNAVSGIASLCMAPFNEVATHVLLSVWICCAVTAVVSGMVLKGYGCAAAIWKYCKR